MGNNQQKVTTQGYQIHDRLGRIKLHQYYDKEEDQTVSIMQLERSIESQKILKAWQLQISRISDTQSKQILLLPLSHTFQGGALCSSSGIANIKYQNLSYVLRGEILNRMKINRYFQERQIWYLLYNMIRAGNKFQRVHRKIGNMHPNNILINEDGQIKLISTCSIPGQLDNFDALTENVQAQAFLAPQELANDSVLNAHYPTGVNECLAEVFSIGLTILSAGSLLDCSSVYQIRKDTFRINQNKIQELLKHFSQRYSSFLSDIVTDMLVINPKNRKKSSQIYELLYQYENQILDLEPFNPPEKYLIHPQNGSQSNYFVSNNYYQQQPVKNLQGSNIQPQYAQHEVRPHYETRQILQGNPLNSMHQSSHLQQLNIPVQIINHNQLVNQNVGPIGQQSNSQIINTRNSQMMQIDSRKMMQPDNRQMIQPDNRQIMQASNSQVLYQRNSQAYPSSSQVHPDINQAYTGHTQLVNSQLLNPGNTQISNPTSNSQMLNSYSQIPRNSQIYQQNTFHTGYSSRHHPSNHIEQSPTQQSSIHRMMPTYQNDVQQQRSFYRPAQQSRYMGSNVISSNVMQGSNIIPSHYVNLNNVDVAQSNYIPNYQFTS